jgi:phosphomannomutase
MPISIDSFEAHDIRGQIPNQINPDICYRIGNATAAFLNADTVESFGVQHSAIGRGRTA